MKKNTMRCICCGDTKNTSKCLISPLIGSVKENIAPLCAEHSVELIRFGIDQLITSYFGALFWLRDHGWKEHDGHWSVTIGEQDQD